MDLKDVVNTFKQLSRLAGEKILKVYREGFEVDYKEDHSPVTLADKLANELITQGLSSRFPSIPVLAEESADDPIRLSHDYCFLVDPLDGTRDFVKKNDEFTVNIALTYKGAPIAGTIYAPVCDELYGASLGNGAFMDVSGREEPIHVSRRIGDIRLAISRSHRTAELDRLIEINHIKHIIVAGSAYKGCLVAKGAVEAYYRFGPTMEWDTASMQILIEEAGGIFLGLNDNPFVYNKENVANPMGFYGLNSIENKLIV